ncbi:hypothetical protein K469DRAFT_706702 [Zopfia rhizophila CBS 207.26]|uniref:YiiM-like triple helical domain-containing protein n=1 Tax=Zopfia rhizophila CBS 207.26 TaxID=1314779 RepID=A0A6A6E498_9PEZI|nr:hypothetical protein K469DRAFT_706702 [Zopfia rhizophila CBS 207.26]
MDNAEAMRELVEIEELGEYVKNIFRNRLDKRVEDQNARVFGDESLAMKTWSEYRIVE